VLLVEVRGAQMVELADFGVGFHFLHHGGIAGGNRLDLGIGERAAVEVFCRSDGCLPVHHLLDEAGLGL
jgi:hypothetical protein